MKLVNPIEEIKRLGCKFRCVSHKIIKTYNTSSSFSIIQISFNGMPSTSATLGLTALPIVSRIIVSIIGLAH